VAESGVHFSEDARRMMDAGADALLVGTALMERPERLREINRL
jgi:indole-3-glycerol phosphate synthase